MGTGVEQASTRASGSMEKWSGAAQKAGAALGALTAASIVVAGDAEASQARVETAFENAGLAIEDFRESLDKLGETGLDLAFDDEDVADSIAKLVTATDDYDKAVQDLSLAQDIARARQISLAQATDLVASAENGRFRSLQMLVGSLGETATAQDYLDEAQRRYAGSSEAFARTGEADFARWQNTAENALEAVGAKLSSVQGPLIALSASSTVLGTVGGLLKDVGAGGAIASLALGPVGLSAAALAAGAGILYLVTRGEEWVDVAQTAALATDNLDNFFASLAATLDPFRAGVIEDLNEQLNQMISDAAQRQSDLEKIVNLKTFTTGMGVNLAEVEADFTGLTQAQLAWLDTNHDAVLSLEEIDAAIVQYQGNLDRLNVDQVEAVQAAITNLLSRPNIDIAKASADIQLWIDQLNAGAITGEQFVELVTNAATKFDDYITAVEGATEAQRAFNLQMEAASEAMNVQAGDLDRLLDPGRILAAVQQRSALITLAHSLETTADATVDATVPTGYFTDALEAQVQKAQDAQDALEDYAAALGEIPAIADTNAARLGANATAAGSSLGNAFRVAVGNTNQIGSQSQQVADWAKELINVSGEYGKIDKLLADGAISLGEYNAAQEAGNQIFDANARIQEDILAIQTKQAPILADLTEEQARYMDHLADLPADQQAVRLAYMDTETSAKALAAAQLAASAAAGELGSAGTAMATDMITAAAEADPYLRALLEDMGLITVGADGTITVNFGSVTDAGASLDDVIDAINTLIGLIADAFNIEITSNAEDRRAELAGIVSLLNGLDGRETTYYVNEVRTGISIGSPNGVGITPELHGGVAGFAGGGVVIRAGEAGGELFNFRGGGSALALTDGLYNVPPGTYVDTAPVTKSKLAGMGGGGGITLNNPTIYIYPATGDIEREFTSSIVGDWRYS